MAPRRLRTKIRVLDRLDNFPASERSEVSILSWNLLGPSVHEQRSGSVSWETVRLPALQRWLARFTTCDVLCFQEVEPGRSLGCLQEALATHGFQEVLQEKEHTLTCATFFKTARLKLIWSQSRSRVLLSCLALPDGRELGIANVHLQAGPSHQDESQRIAQLNSAMERLRARSPWCPVVCGDFNSELEQGSTLLTLLTEYGLCKTMASGPTYVVKNCTGVLDHIFAGKALKQQAVLGSDAAALRASSVSGLPDADHPSDHLPVAVIFKVDPSRSAPSQVAQATSTAVSVVPLPEAPISVHASILQEWVEISRLAVPPPLGTNKKERTRLLREQQQLESEFLSIVGGEAACLLVSWRRQAAEAARSIVQQAVSGAFALAAGSGATSSEHCHVFDASGDNLCAENCGTALPTWAGC